VIDRALGITSIALAVIGLQQLPRRWRWAVGGAGVVLLALALWVAVVPFDSRPASWPALTTIPVPPRGGAGGAGLAAGGAGGDGAVIALPGGGFIVCGAGGGGGGVGVSGGIGGAGAPGACGNYASAAGGGEGGMLLPPAPSR